MANLNGFNANEVEPTTDFDPIPAGKYLAVITESESKPNKAGTGSYLQLTFQVIEGEYKNRFLWARLNLDNPNQTAVKIALALADAFGCGVNDLPLSLIVSWYEQKAVAILLTLLHLGVKNIRLGPSLPAFITPNVLNVLVEKFAIKPVGTVDEDLAEILS